MKTTLNLDDAVVRAAKRRAIEEDISLTRLLEDALRRYLQPPQASRTPFRLRLLIRRGDPAPGVDLEDRDALYDRMEDRR